MHVIPEQPAISVLMCIYKKDCCDYVNVAIESIVNQTRCPDEIVLVKDGPVSDELHDLIRKWCDNFPGLFHIVSLPENCGLGVALQEGLKVCSNDIVARMDADDISCPDRFEKQLKFLQENRDVAVVSSWIGCFQNATSNIFVRRMPIKPEHINRASKFRNPINGAPAMFWRSAAEAVGGYHDWRLAQDYHLWVRMIMNKYRITCIPQVLYRVRLSGVYERRSGLKWLLLHIRLQKEFLKIGFISFPQYLFNVFIRFIICILPVRTMRFIRTKFLKL
jgi:glycosyltransferase involved in cell wall biosynthesis